MKTRLNQIVFLSQSEILCSSLSCESQSPYLPSDLSSRQEVLLLDNEIAFNEAIIEERDQGIHEIQQQIGEVNEIFKDLAVLVHEQGTMIGKSGLDNSIFFLFVFWLIFDLGTSLMFDVRLRYLYNIYSLCYQLMLEFRMLP